VGSEMCIRDRVEAAAAAADLFFMGEVHF